MRTLSIAFVILFLSVLGLWQSSQAQGHLSANFRMGIPQGEMADNVSTIAYGGGANVLVPIGGNKSPILLGGEFQFSLYGRTTKQLQTPPLFGLSRRYRIATNNNFASVHGTIRLKPNFDNFLVEPYLDGLLGVNFFYTATTITDITNNNVNTDPNDPDNNNPGISNRTPEHNDNALSYGGAVGFLIGKGPIRLDLRCVYLLGGVASYVDRESVQIDPTANNGQGQVTFDKKTSRTDMIMPSIGICFMFGE